MFRIIFIIFLLISSSVKSEDFKLLCYEANSSNSDIFLKSFIKIVNFEEQTLYNHSGGYFDDVILFGRNEIVIKNKIFNTRGTFNIITNVWTIYKGQFVKIYNCTIERRRF